MIVDSLTRDEILRQPALTAVDAARRIPGVSVDYNNNSGRGRGAARNIAIRGFAADYNLITVDGLQIASIDPGSLNSGTLKRSFNLAMIPSSLMARMDVRKTWTAEWDPQALGGQADVITHSAFATRKTTYVDIISYGGYDTTSGTSSSDAAPSVRSSAIISHRIGTGETRLGLTVAGAYQETHSANTGLSVGLPSKSDPVSVGWTYYGSNGKAVAGPGPGASAAVPTRLDSYSFDDHTMRASVFGKIELRHGKALRSTVAGGYYTSQEIETRNELLMTRTPNSAIAGTGAFGTGAPLNVTGTSGYYPVADAEVGLQYQPIRAFTRFLLWKNSYEFAPHARLSLDLSGSQASADEYQNRIKYAAGVRVSNSGSTSTISSPNIGFSYDTSRFVPSASLTDPAIFAKDGKIIGDYWITQNMQEQQRLLSILPRFEWNASSHDYGFRLRSGMQFTQTNTSYTPRYNSFAPRKPGEFSLSDVLLQNDARSDHFGHIPFPMIDRNAADAVRYANPSRFSTIDQSAKNFGNVFALSERSLAGYVSGGYRSAVAEVMLGLRYETTTDHFGSYKLVAPSIYRLVHDRAAFRKPLPYIVSLYRITPDLSAHVAYSRTIGRPDYSAFVPQYSIGTPNGGQINITTGNPDIKPRLAHNIDAALDLSLLGGNALLSVQYFHKILSNQFYNLAYSAPYVYDGVTYTGNFTQVRNGGSASVDGVELNIMALKLPVLPSRLGIVGLTTNLTYMATRYTILDSRERRRSLPNLPGQPDYIVNVALSYQIRQLDLAVLFYRQGKSLYRNGAVPWMDMYVLPQNKLDVNVRYAITPRIQALVQGANLTQASYRTALGPRQNLAGDHYRVGTRVWGGMRVTF
ncbi:TonB-dependent receptor [Swaminathania salitolerans LMG 21291]|uniref:TonB-dependent receptor n=1 Tax=Swaminathania salitolerans TaxID=182838 RepID=A0A511BN96_9PROT|nr:TonB-dependent receptor [Swaminathania salitolerans LMG 21291]GEL01134.1 TonB-dependent receptor [Swaminathania salitolerans]